MQVTTVGTEPPQRGSRHKAAATWQSAQSRRNNDSRHIAAATWQSAHSRRNMAVGTKPPQSQSAQSRCNMAVGTQPPQEHQCQSRRKNSRHEAAARWQLAKKNADQPSRHEADETKSRRLKNRSGQKNQLLPNLFLLQSYLKSICH